MDCIMAVRKDCGLKNPASQMQLGIAKSLTQFSSSRILIRRSTYQAVRPFMDGYARLVQLSGTLSKYRAFCRFSISEVMVSSPYEDKTITTILITLTMMMLMMVNEAWEYLHYIVIGYFINFWKGKRGSPQSISFVVFMHLIDPLFTIGQNGDWQTNYVITMHRIHHNYFH